MLPNESASRHSFLRPFVRTRSAVSSSAEHSITRLLGSHLRKNACQCALATTVTAVDDIDTSKIFDGVWHRPPIEDARVL